MSLYRGVAVTQFYGQSAHQVGREGLTDAVLSAEILHADQDASDTRGLLLVTAWFVSTGTDVCACPARVCHPRGLSQPRL